MNDRGRKVVPGEKVKLPSGFAMQVEIDEVVADPNLGQSVPDSTGVTAPNSPIHGHDHGGLRGGRIRNKRQEQVGLQW